MNAYQMLIYEAHVNLTKLYFFGPYLDLRARHVSIGMDDAGDAIFRTHRQGGKILSKDTPLSTGGRLA